MATDTTLLICACIAATAALVLAEYRKSRIGRIFFKTVASTAFVLVALQAGATESTYGRLVLAALALSWIGDVLLLSTRSRLFLLGIAAFLLAHVAYSVAFTRLPTSMPALIAGLAAVACIAAAVLRWLRPHLSSFYRIAVTAYVAAIVAMCSLAISSSAATGDWLLAAAALAFAASDISVARNRFVSPGFANRAWGLPLYYAAQLVLALSVGGYPIRAA